MAAEPLLYTIGHSAHPAERFLMLLLQHGIKTLVDVRTLPYSHYHPQFRRASLEDLIPAIGIHYVYLGKELGGRPTGAHLMTADGRPDYRRMALLPAFKDALEQVLTLATAAPIPHLMCSEQDPLKCHRCNLIAHEVRDRGVRVLHIRKYGGAEEERWDQPQQLPLLADQPVTVRGNRAR
ncbi:MAG: DUF488 domain-containing protein [Dehalococcoidia bacterium]|nr:DUF488 domain-containing protein [Dehalococcoidia bacterium]